MPRDLFQDVPRLNRDREADHVATDLTDIDLLYAGHSPEFLCVRVDAEGSRWQYLPRSLVERYAHTGLDTVKVTMSETDARKEGLLR